MTITMWPIVSRWKGNVEVLITLIIQKSAFQDTKPRPEPFMTSGRTEDCEGGNLQLHETPSHEVGIESILRPAGSKK
jgi:hypothetical protein